MNRIDQLFNKKKENILSIYFTAGHPYFSSTEEIVLRLEKAGVDIVEIGIPFSDPIADGPTIQKSSSSALENGMTLTLLLEQIREIREVSNIPIMLMGYLNPIYQYGLDRFIKQVAQIGIDGLIIPDLPLEVYEKDYHHLFRKHNVKNIFLVTPLTPAARITEIDKYHQGFIYFVSAATTTGSKNLDTESQKRYFEKIRSLKLNNAKLIGFGIHNRQSFENACKYANGAIVGSAFIDALNTKKHIDQCVSSFVQSLGKTPLQKIQNHLS